MLSIGILYSCLFAGEYTAVALGIATVFALTVLVNPLAGRYPFLSLSSGEYDLDGAWSLSSGFPLTAVGVKLLLAAILWETANRVVSKRSF